VKALPLIMAVLASLTLTAAPHAQEAPLEVPIFPLSSLKPGLIGTAHTVVRGTKIETFKVEVLDLIPDGGPDGGPAVLARFSGPIVEASNGIAAGYSGSPVYIGKQLLGAVSMAIPFSDTHIGGITPIGSMLSALPDGEDPDYSKNSVLPPTTNNGLPLDKEGNVITSWVTDVDQARRLNDAAKLRGSHELTAVACTTPILTSGLSPYVLKQLKDKLPARYGDLIEFDSKPMGNAASLAASGGSSTKAGLLLGGSQSPLPLIAGDAVSVSLVQGDIEMYGIGTVTYSDKQGRVLIFGHPMLQIGKTNMPLGKAYVTWTYKSIERAFKEGVRLNTVGTMTKDQLAACGGTFNMQPDLIPVKIKINDLDKNVSHGLSLQVIRNPDLTPMLVAAAMSQAVSRELDRQPGGTLKMSYYIEGAGLTEPLKRENFYSNDADVVSDAAFDLYPLSSLLETNIYRDVKVTEIRVQCDITRNRINASIDDAKIVWDKPAADPAAAAVSALPAMPVPEGVEPPKTDAESGDADSAPTAQQTPGATVPGTPVMPYNPMGNLPTFKPGETIQVKVRLQPYHTAAVWRMFEVKVPSDFPSGSTMLVVHGGGDLVSMSEFGGKGRQLFGFGPALSGEERDLDSLIDQVMNWPLNNELVLTLMRPYDPSQAQQLGGGSSTNPMSVMPGGSNPVEDDPAKKVDAKFQMEWVIYNGFYLPVNIMSDKDMQAMQAAMQAAQVGVPPADGSKPAKPGDKPKDSEPKTNPGQQVDTLWRGVTLPQPGPGLTKVVRAD
jgi:hypothetical protein